MTSDQIKVGDKLHFKGRFFEGIRVVTRITPSGRIIVDDTRNNHQYHLNPDLTVRGEKDPWSGLTVTKIASAEQEQDILDRLRKARLARALETANWSTLSLESLEKVLRILKGGAKTAPTGTRQHNSKGDIE